MSEAYRIRPARPADRDLIVRFNRAMARETEDRDLEEATIMAGVGAVLADPSKGRYYIAESVEVEPGGQAQPAGQLMVTPEWSDWRNGIVWWIQSVYVAPAHRRRGVYRMLHEHVREAGRAQGVVGLRLYVDRDNITAQDTYGVIGMSESRYIMYEEDWA
ncbi:MAG: GNAT family N-acetyltransferase [Gemmatimonadales bacterium]|jgi:GNAT superfamily N-acetyltransferase